TEAHVIASLPLDGPWPWGSVGLPLAGIEVEVVDAAGQLLPAGEVGAVRVRGPNLFREYWRNPEATAKAFAGGWFHSGDLVRQDDEGFVWVVNRKKDMIISGGENIYCAELEHAIAEHPSVAEVAVIGRADERWGQVPVAFVSVTSGADLSLAELTGFLDGRLASFKKPKDLVVLPALPRNAGGKVVKGSLRTLDEENAATGPDPDRRSPS
ncbi:MAG TPA: AMP-binding protein, partial [Umezawaea sp.]|nr:AMP-binding protein [Umezawaea sp.]